MKHCPKLFFLLATICLAAEHTPTIHVDLSQPGPPLEIGKMALGQGGLSPDPIWADRMPEIKALHPRVIRLFVQEYFHVLPKAGQYDWSSLDQAVDLIVQTGATPLMTIAIKPAVLFPKIDHAITDPTDYAVWDNLMFAMAKHYKDRGSRIVYWEIANEPDIGEQGGCPYLFTPEGYVRYYAHTAAAIKRADPAAKTGGPALANYKSAILPALVAAADSQGLPLDFISWHGYNSDPMSFRASIDWQKAILKKFPKQHPETFLDEWNMSLSNPVADPRFQPVFVAETIWQMKDAGLDYSCYYQIRDYHVQPEIFTPFFSKEGAAAMAKWWNIMPQYDGLFDYQNRVRPAYFTFLLLSRLTGQRLPLTSTEKSVHGFATYDSFYGTWNLLFWNYSDRKIPITLSIDGASALMEGSPTVLDAAAPSDDENVRLRRQPRVKIASGSTKVPVTLEPWQVVYWSIEAHQR